MSTQDAWTQTSAGNPNELNRHSKCYGVFITHSTPIPASRLEEGPRQIGEHFPFAKRPSDMHADGEEENSKPYQSDLKTENEESRDMPRASMKC